ncbi:RodZ domain-containing protein [Dyella sp.]|uniref:RodZ domain-containing protein n=1 Tax=Dyella sp. TaxID=1869338 RepID=UPI002ED15C23
MTSKQSQPAENEDRGTELFNASAQAMETSSPGATSQFGARLRAAREARGLSVEHCGQTLRLPIRVLRQLEGGDYSGIDYQVYLTSYLAKYGRFLGVDEATIQAELERLKPTQAQPALVATGGISHSRYLLENYLRAATYVVLTGVIAVPAIWLGMRGAFDRDISHLAPLDASPVAQQEPLAPASSTSALAAHLPADSSSAALAATESAPASTVPQVQSPRQDDQQPLLASMAPFPNLGSGDNAAKPVISAPQVTGSGAHSLVLNVPNDSWVNITRKDGSRLEFSLLRAGTSKTYQSDQPLDVLIGNANGAQVTLDGQPVALESFRRANVAHFHMDVQDGKAAATSAPASL